MELEEIAKLPKSGFKTQLLSFLMSAHNPQEWIIKDANVASEVAEQLKKMLELSELNTLQKALLRAEISKALNIIVGRTYSEEG